LSKLNEEERLRITMQEIEIQLQLSAVLQINELNEIVAIHVLEDVLAMLPDATPAQHQKVMQLRKEITIAMVTIAARNVADKLQGERLQNEEPPQKPEGD
jgi:hypothetical protein